MLACPEIGPHGCSMGHRIQIPGEERVSLPGRIHFLTLDQAFGCGQHHLGVVGVGSRGEEIARVSRVGLDEIGDRFAVVAFYLVAREKLSWHSQSITDTEPQYGARKAAGKLWVGSLQVFYHRSSDSSRL